MKPFVYWSVLVATTICLGCSQQPSASSNATGPTVADSVYLLPTEPPEAKGVIEVRESKEEGPVTVVGRIGGSVNPWVEGRAAFSIVDPLLLACSDREGDDCATPWDYCCETDRLPRATALVKIVDESGALVAQDSRQLLGLKELQTVVVQGTSERDEAGNLTILATGVFIRP